MKRTGYMLLLIFVAVLFSCNVFAEEDYMTESGEIREVEEGEVMTDSGELEEVGPGGEYMTDSGAIGEVSDAGPASGPGMGTGPGDEGGYPYESDSGERE